MLRTRYFLFIATILATHIMYGQNKYANLTVLLKNVPQELVEEKIYSIYNSQNPSTANDRLELKFWKFCMLDSFQLEKPAHNLAKILQSSVPKLKTSNRYLVYERIADDFYANADFKNAIAVSLKTIRSSGIEIKGKASANRLIGLSYSKLKQYETAKKYLNKSITLYTKINNFRGIAKAKMTLGNVFKSQKKFDKALETYLESLVIAEEIDDSRLVAGNLNNMGSAYRQKGDIQRGIEYYLKALEINKKSGNRQWESFNYNNLANCYDDLNQDEKALEYFKKSSEIKLELGDSIALMETYFGMSNAYANLKDYKSGYDYLFEYNKMKERFDLADQARLLAESEGKYNTAKKQVQIDELEAQKELELLKNEQLELKAERNRMFFIFLGCIGLLLFGGLIYLYRSNKTRQRLNEALSSANKDISLKNTEIIDSINYATQIQRASLPNMVDSSTKRISFELFFAPKDIVSGDFYFSYSNGSKTFFGLGDCTGHGVPGAMVSLIGLNAFEKVVNDKSELQASKIVEEVNESVIQSLYRGEEINDGMDVSFCVVDEKDMTAQFVGANHTAYLLRTKNETTEYVEYPLREENDDFKLYQLNGARRPIGKSYSQEAFFQIEIPLRVGDRIIVGTDGYADQFGGPKGKKMKKMGLISTLIKSASLPVDQQLERLKMEFYSWKGLHEQVDDVCVLIAEVK